ncbi:MAG: NUDIX domain-containing protein [Candidatus Saccharimonas sp.]
MAKEQAFLPSGIAAEGISFERIDFGTRKDYLMGTVHVWIWRRRGENGIEILLQQRSLSKKSHPGMLDISVAGHIDEGETDLQTVCREAKEEVGLNVDVSRLEFAFRLRKTNVSNVIATVYLYEVDDSFAPRFDDGEVEDSRWVSIGQFTDMTNSPGAYNLAHHGTGYFQILVERLNLL